MSATKKGTHLMFSFQRKLQKYYYSYSRTGKEE